MLAPGTVLGDYTVDKVLGAGGFGITYLAFEIATGEFVAIKEYFPKSAAVRDESGSVWINDHKNEEAFNRGLKRFWEEAETLARFRHPHIVKALRRFQANGTAYIVLEYIAGASLEQWARELPTPPAQDQLDAFMVALTAALEVIHRNDFLHRDLAPKNILLLPDGLPVLIDFGSARLVDRAGNLTAMVTPYYAPYEQHWTSGQGQGPWTDIYGASATIYRVLTGRPPADAMTRALDDSQYVPLVGQGQLSGVYRRKFLKSLDWGLKVHHKDRPQNVAAWRAVMFEGNPIPKPLSGLHTEIARKRERPRPVVDRLRRLLHINSGEE